MGKTRRSGDYVNLFRNSSFFVGSGKDFKGSKTFQKVKMHALFLFNLKLRWNRGGSAAMPAAAASGGFLDEGTVQAAAATDFVRVAATTFLGTPGALAAGASGGTTTVPRSNGGFAGAATDLLDATNFQGMEKPAGAATDLLDALNSGCMEPVVLGLTPWWASCCRGCFAGCVEFQVHGRAFCSRCD